MAHWYHNKSDVLEVARYLVSDRDYTAAQLLSFFEKPWKWEPDRSLMLQQEKQ